MVLLDTNIYIYLAQGALAAECVAEVDIACASITKIEALGFPSLPAQELVLLSALFAESHVIDISAAIVDRAVQLRQVRKMSLGDALIAATALEHDLELWTANLGDFSVVEGLRLYNPLSS